MNHRPRDHKARDLVGVLVVRVSLDPLQALFKDSRVGTHSLVLDPEE